MKSVLLVPVGRPRGGHLKRLAVALGGELSLEVSISRQQLDPRSTEIPNRGQFNSTQLLQQLDSLDLQGHQRVLGVTELDISIPILTYVFGEAMVAGKAAVISTCRLDPRFYGQAKDNVLFERRILLEALHELGHTAGLRHCPDWQCVMHSATDVEEIDVRGQFYCSSCKRAMLA